MNFFKLVLAMSIVLGFAGSAAALDSTILSVQRTDGAEVEFNLDQLEALEPYTLITHTVWTDGPQQFTGVRLTTLFEAAGVKQGATIKAMALNDYAVELPWSDIRKYPVIVAYQLNGEYMPIRDRGPLWIIYPQDDYPKLRGSGVQAKMIWQLNSLQAVQ